MSRSAWTPAYIGIGSNLDDPQKQVLRGFDALATLTRSQLVVRSRLYRTAPLGPQDQPSYINAVAGLLTQLDARTLLMELKSLEKKLGRAVPAQRWGPRVIDFDLLSLGSERIDSEDLQVPHRGVAERAFVLVPLAEVAPHANIPGIGQPVDLLAAVDASGVESV